MMRFFIPFLCGIFCLFCVTPVFSRGLMLMDTTYHGMSMGTGWRATLPPEDAGKTVTQEEIQAVLDAVDRRMSTWKKDSELSRINATEDISQDIPLSPELAKVLTAALEVSRKTGGAYDVTVGPLVNVWKFGPREEEEDFVPPADAKIAAVKEKIGWKFLEIYPAKDGTPLLKRKKAGLYVDLSSIAKGYAVDQVAEALLAAGVTRFMVEVGGEVRVGEKKEDGRPWRIGIEDPLHPDGPLYGAVQLENESLASSGGYRNFKAMSGGKRASHIIDPRTGRPVENQLLEVSVVAETCMEADAWATALSVLGEVEGPKCAAQQNPPLRVAFLMKNTEKPLPPDGPEVSAICQNFPLVALPRETSDIYGEPRVSATGHGGKILGVVIISILFFGLFFLAVGLNHLLGRRKMMCACKSARAMEAEREQLIKTIRPVEENEELGARDEE